jgi:hypothetical protein
MLILRDESARLPHRCGSNLLFSPQVMQASSEEGYAVRLACFRRSHFVPAVRISKKRNRPAVIIHKDKYLMQN